MLAGLAEVGYEGLTMDMVAARAKAGKGALYRRWPSKPALVIDALSHLRPAPVLPDQGSLIADLDMLVVLATPERQRVPGVELMAGIASAAQRDPELAEALRTQFLEPRKQAIRSIIERAQGRGELARDLEIDLILEIVPAMVMHRALVMQMTPDREFIVKVLHTIVLPALLHERVTPQAD